MFQSVSNDVKLSVNYVELLTLQCDTVNDAQAILFFQCKVSTSRHKVGEYKMKDLAFVEELWTFKQPARRSDMLTSEFNVRRLYRTSPTPTYYVLDVWRIIGLLYL